ncbi:hypothetical protein DFJ58DRAFT_845926 [Suillus subalutaceus]|uniref:uncharacterized protein n=1 Tax=Suillus subalutaceus TaxID=48586 RepID=UPI001B85CE09|nr:uncharacterized protein DFJ58DRAFT_845926 [Suillus subalutaceus]KAG1838804.1 hypothetical protein DFJ58DRAFT_845926 [Suillus subalutaceus]
MSDLDQVISLLGALQMQMQVVQSLTSLWQDLQQEINSSRRDLQQEINSLHCSLQQDIAILGQDVGRDVTSLQQDVKAMQGNVTSLQGNDLTLKQAMAHNLDQLSSQFVGLVGDFKQLADTIYSSFDSWAKEAHSRVIDKVLEIQRPRLKAIENKLHKNICTCIPPGPVYGPSAHTSDEAESENTSSSEGANSPLSIETASSGGNGTFGSHHLP